MIHRVFDRHGAFRRTLVAVALGAAYSVSWALPTFTLNLAAQGFAGTEFTADNVLTSDFSGVTFIDATHFVDNGFLQVTSVQLGGNTFIPSESTASGGGFTITQGGGSINLASPVSEPDTYALILGGLGLFGLLLRRRWS